MPKNTKPRERLISNIEIAKILEVMEYIPGEPVISNKQKMAVLWLLAIETAMCQGEIFKIHWDDINFNTSVVQIIQYKERNRS